MSILSRPLELLKPKNYKANKVLLKLIISLIVPIISVMLVVSISFSILYSNESMTDINSSAYLTLSNISTSVSNLMESSKQTAFEIYKNANITSLLLDNNRDNRFKAARYLTSIVVANPQLYSIYIYYDHKVLISYGESAFFTENDQQIGALFTTGENLKPKPRIIKTTFGTLNVITTLYSREFSENGGTALVVLNYTTDGLYQQVDESLLKNDQNLIIADKYGNILAHSNKKLFAANIAEQDYFKKAIGSGLNYGNFQYEFNGKKSITHYAFDETRSYLVFFNSDYNRFFARILNTRNNIIYFCIVLFFLLVLVSAFISYKIYTPINNVFSNIRKLLGGGQNIRGDLSGETKYISNAITSVIERLNSLEKDNASNHISLKNDFISKLLTMQDRTIKKDCEAGLSNFGIDMGQGYKYQMVIFRLDNSKTFIETNSNESVSFQLASIESIAADCIKPYADCSTFSIDNLHIILLINYPPDSKVLDGNRLIAILESFKSTVSQLFNLSFTIGIGNTVNELTVEEFRAMYKQTYGLTDYRLVYGKGNIFEADRIIIEEDNAENSADMILSITGSARSGSFEQYAKGLDQLFGMMKRFSYCKIIHTLFNLEKSIEQITIDLHTVKAAYETEDIEQLYIRIKSFEDFNEVRAWFIELYNTTNQILSGLKNSKTSDLIDETLSYINVNFKDSMLSATVMAEKLGITPQYFSKIFKVHTGMTFPDYINNIRLEKAKELLTLNPLISIAKVCELIGYNSTSYFSTSFSKKFGIPPSKYSLISKEI